MKRPPVAISERAFQDSLLELAALMNWRAYHTHDSRRSKRGFPDLVLVRAPRVIFAELKADRGRLEDDQRAWLHDLLKCAPRVEAYVWRPRDWDRITEILRHRSSPDDGIDRSTLKLLLEHTTAGHLYMTADPDSATRHAVASHDDDGHPATRRPIAVFDNAADAALFMSAREVITRLLGREEIGE